MRLRLWLRFSPPRAVTTVVLTTQFERSDPATGRGLPAFDAPEALQGCGFVALHGPIWP